MRGGGPLSRQQRGPSPQVIPFLTAQQPPDGAAGVTHGTADAVARAAGRITGRAARLLAAFQQIAAEALDRVQRELGIQRERKVIEGPFVVHGDVQAQRGDGGRALEVLARQAGVGLAPGLELGRGGRHGRQVGFALAQHEGHMHLLEGIGNSALEAGH